MDGFLFVANEFDLLNLFESPHELSFFSMQDKIDVSLGIPAVAALHVPNHFLTNFGEAATVAKRRCKFSNFISELQI